MNDRAVGAIGVALQPAKIMAMLTVDTIASLRARPPGLRVFLM